MKDVANLFEDPLLLRVGVVIWGTALALFPALLLVSWRPGSATDWLLYGAFTAMACVGLYLLRSALFGSDDSVRKAASRVEDNSSLGVILLALAVRVVALPVVAIIRMVKPRGFAGE